MDQARLRLVRRIVSCAYGPETFVRSGTCRARTLRRDTSEGAEPLLAEALTGRNHFLVAKSADLPVHHGLTGCCRILLPHFRGSSRELAPDEPELLGACCSGVLALEGTAALPWTAKFLPPEDDAAVEAAMAMAQTRTGEAFPLLRGAWGQAKEPWFSSAVLQAIALTRQEDAMAWLLGLVAVEGRDAGEAHTALCRSAPSESALNHLQALGRPCPPKR